MCSPPAIPSPQVQVAFTVVRYSTERFGERQGVATSWLNALCAPLASGPFAADGTVAEGTAANGAAANGASAAVPIRLPVFLRRGGAFGPPDSLATPLLMIGPGTGVAPFRGFLQHRRAQAAAQAQAQGGSGEGAAADGSKGAAWLFFGCRREDQDFLYREDLQARKILQNAAAALWCVAASWVDQDFLYREDVQASQVCSIQSAAFCCFVAGWEDQDLLHKQDLQASQVCSCFS